MKINNPRIYCVALGLLLLPCAVSAYEIAITQSALPAWTEKPAASTGLDLLTVVNNAQGACLTVSGIKSPGAVKWLRFANLGAAYAEEVPGSEVSITSDGCSVRLKGGDAGYVIETSEGTRYVWIVDYSKHVLELKSLSIDEDSDCSNLVLNVEGSGSKITYFTINGRAVELSRELTLGYNTAVYSEEGGRFISQHTEEVIPYFNSSITLTPPLADTEFTLRGDRFLTFWEMGSAVTSPYFTTRAVDAFTSAAQAVHESDNQIKDEGGESGSLGGSAPCEIKFVADVTEAAVFREWQMSQTEDFEVLDLTFPQDELEYTFTDQGTTYVRFVAADNSGECRYESPVYTVSVGESRLLCPNAFSPQASPGVNDIWKVSYKSLLSFECHIFNSRGVEIFSFRNPDDGWDGKYKGKFVPAGVYYYVIQAKGSDGKIYKLSGDINIVNFHGGSTQPSEGDGNDNSPQSHRR